MKAIWKTILSLTDVQEIDVPQGAEFLCAHEQSEQLCVWYWCDPKASKAVRLIAIVGTGHAAPEPAEASYIGTAFLQSGSLVLHVFEKS